MSRPEHYEEAQRILFTPAGAEDALNNVCAAGGVYEALRRADLDPVVVVMDDGKATNAITVKLGFMNSRYRVTVERVPDDPDGAP